MIIYELTIMVEAENTGTSAVVAVQKSLKLQLVFAKRQKKDER